MQGARILAGFLQWHMGQRFDVCIRGDGVVGRSLALLLARERLRVALLRPAQDGPPQDVRAYAINRASRQALEAIRAWPSGDAPTPVKSMQVWGDEGGQIRFEAEPGQHALAWLIPATDLLEGLTQALHFAPQVTLIESLTGIEADLQVVCEGRDSSSRRELGITWDSRPYAQRALAARLRGSLPHDGQARQWFVKGEVMALLPMGGIGGCEWALVWSVSLERAGALQALSAEEFVAAITACVDTQAGDLSLCSPVMAWPLHLSQADRWVGPGWALAGDAAHTVHPLAGQGLNLGLADAVELARVIGEREFWRSPGDLRLLRRYERSRKADVQAMGLLTDGLQGLFGHTDARWQALRNWGMNAVGSQGWLKAWLMKQAMG
jgi:2-polyprenyl-6-methoxyphenol hydroxylase-like FAD-dependent oxidoreductase